jgi:DNA-binding transcriptional LysR family regulator
MMSINELRSITTFVRTVELGSLSKAATAQQISPQAASKALGQLEQYLGVRLFHRTTRRMSLTEEGQRFFEAAKPSLTSLQQALHAVRQTREDLAGPLRIVGPRTVLQPVIGPVLDEYCRLYPEVQPDVQLDDRVGNWVEDRVDVGFRLGNPPEEGLDRTPPVPDAIGDLCRPDLSAQVRGAANPVRVGCAPLQWISATQRWAGCALARESWRQPAGPEHSSKLFDQ